MKGNISRHIHIKCQQVTHAVKYNRFLKVRILNHVIKGIILVLGLKCKQCDFRCHLQNHQKISFASCLW